MKHPPTSEHNYLAKFAAAAESMSEAERGCQVIEVHHDEWCDFFQGRGFCNCDPIVTLAPAH